MKRLREERMLTNEDIDELKDYLDEIKERRYYDFEFERIEELKSKLDKLKIKPPRPSKGRGGRYLLRD